MKKAIEISIAVVALVLGTLSVLLACMAIGVVALVLTAVNFGILIQAA
jgi:hypothetical protein